MRGRKPKPAALRELHGNPGKRRKLPKPKAPSATIAPPPHLQGEALAEWRRITAELSAVDMVRPLDVALLSVWCGAWADLVAAEVALNDSRITTDKNGDQRRSPWFFVRANAVRELMRLAGEFGLSPSARMRLMSDGARLPPPIPAAQGGAPGKTLDEYLAEGEELEADWAAKH